MFSDLTDGGTPMFIYEEGELTLDPNESVELSFSISNEAISSSYINLSIWPIYHDYALKELLFNVVQNNVLLGDVNLDGTINVIDIVDLVNVVLNNSFLNSADINQDQSINVLDIIALVNIILDN